MYDKAFTLDWKEIVELYNILDDGSICLTQDRLQLLTRLGEALKPRDVMEG